MMMMILRRHQRCVVHSSTNVKYAFISLIFSISEKFHYFYKPKKHTNSVVLRSLLKLEKQIMDSLPYLEDSFKEDMELFRKKMKEKMYKLDT